MNDHFSPGREAGAAAAAQARLLDVVDDLGGRHAQRLLERRGIHRAARQPASVRASTSPKCVERTGVSRGWDLCG